MVPWVRGMHSCLAVIGMNQQIVYCLVVLVIINCKFMTQMFDSHNKKNVKKYYVFRSYCAIFSDRTLS
jgi:hypothetical protein